MKSKYLILVMGALLAACSTGFDEAAWSAEGQRVLQPLKQNLMGALMDGMQDGPAAAIEVCQLQAPGMPDAASGTGFTVGRTSHRLRNPDNAPAAWMVPLLDKYNVDSVRAPQAVELDGGAIGYVEPIYMQGLCLTCHGTQLMPSVAAMLATAYPNDQATGFAEGDFRGLFWVRFEPGYEPALSEQGQGEQAMAAPQMATPQKVAPQKTAPSQVTLQLATPQKTAPLQVTLQLATPQKVAPQKDV